MKNDANERFRQVRAHLGISQTEMATQLNVSVSLVSKIESGDVFPSNKILKAISEKWGIDIEYLTGGIGILKVNSKQTGSDNIYQDALYKELKADKETWQQKYNELFQMFRSVLERGSAKHKATELAGLSKKISRFVARA